jgi:hypothetical protein
MAVIFIFATVPVKTYFRLSLPLFAVGSPAQKEKQKAVKISSGVSLASSLRPHHAKPLSNPIPKPDP